MRSSVDALIVIPVYNHGSTLRAVAEGVLAIHKDVLIVDDGSTDDGAKTVADLPVQVVKHDTNQGKGQAILTAVEIAKAQGKTHIITIDADGQHMPSDIPAFLAAMEDDPRAIVVGARNFDTPNVPGSSRFGRKFSNFWLRVQTGVKLSDVQCGFRAYPLIIFDAITTRERRYAFEVEVLVKSAWASYPLKDVDIDVHYPKPQERVSHFKALKDNIDISLLNTRLTARSFMPVPHRQYTEDEEGKVSAIHPMKSLRMLLEKDETPAALALAGALGMLLGALPIIGLHCVAIVFLLGYLRLSKITGLAVSQLCIPPFVPALCIEAGYFMRHGQFLTDISLQTLGYEALDRLWEYVLGSLVVAPALALLMGGVIYVLAKIAQRRLNKNGGTVQERTSTTDKKSWSSQSLASDFFHKIFYVAIKLLGRHVAYFMLIFVVAFYTLLPKVRKRSREYRHRQFGPRSFPSELADCYKLQWEFGKMLVDRAVMGILGQFEMKASHADKQQLADLAAQGRGLILITGHAGCWQLGMSTLEHIDAPKAVVMYKDDRDVDRHYFEHGKSDAPQTPPFTIIDPRSPMGGTLEMMEILKQRGVLCVMGDRNFGSPKGVVDVEFMGGTIAVPYSAYKLASTMDVPMAVTFSHRTGPGHGRIWISRVIDVPTGLGRSPEAYRPYAQRFADGLAEFVGRYPYQFYNFFNMWKKDK